LGAEGITIFLSVFGVGAVVGNALGAWLTERLGSQRTLMVLAVAQMILLPALTLVPLGIAGALALTLLWSLGAWSFMVPQQARLVSLGPQHQGLLLALNASAIYVGVSIGSTIGSWTLSHATFGALGPVAAAVGGVALTSLFVSSAPPVNKPMEEP
jgi:predicted MFS family arabinose efflux permease